MFEDKRYALDPDTCFCFECDAPSWDVLEHYPALPANRIYRLLEEKHARRELEEVVGELEWLRASRSILQPPRQEDFQKRYEIEPGLILVRVDAAPADAVQDGGASARRGWWGRGAKRQAAAPQDTAFARVEQAAQLLLARSGRHRELRLEIALVPGIDPLSLAPVLNRILRQAQVSGKRLVLSLGYDDLPVQHLPEPLRGHTVGAWFETVSDKPAAMEDLVRVAAGRLDRLDRIAGAYKDGGESVTGRVVLRPGHGAFGGVVAALESAGFNRIDLDVDGAFVGTPGIDPAAFTESLRANAAYYAGRLLKNHHYRVEPFATLFLRIFHGTAVFRTDPVGVHALAVDAAGGIWPDRHFTGREGVLLGRLGAGPLEEASLKRFEDVGALTTAACLRCWARGLCGGGCAAVHASLTGNFRVPHDPWCQAQRAWMEGAVAAFNTLSSAGVDFTRVYESLGRTGRPSLWMMAKMAKTALQMRVLMRPIEEADAELLTRWENWNEAAYFTCHESGLLLATRYDREMDALHPRAYEQEFMITDRAGAPMGLVKIRPDRLAGLANVWLYLRRGEDYAADGVRTGLRALLREALKGRAVKRLIAPAGPKEDGLAACLQAIGFQPAGTARKALYLHGQYHDVRLFVCEAETD